MSWYSDLLGVLGNAFKIGKVTLNAEGVSSPQTITLPASGGTLATVERVGVSIATTPPQSPTNGKLWFDSEHGSLLVYYDDGSSSQWLEPLVNAEGISGPVGLRGTSILSGTTNPTDDIGQNGDFYLNTRLGLLAGPKTEGAWNLEPIYTPTTFLLTAFQSAPTGGNNTPYRLGFKFTPLQECRLKSFKRWKNTGDTTVAYGYIALASGGPVLASAIFTNETESGWQTSNELSEPLVLEVGTQYLAWYYGWGVWSSGSFPGNPVATWDISMWDSGGTASNPPTTTWDQGGYYLDLNLDVITYPGIVLTAISGRGMPPGGENEQVLVKKTSADDDVKWEYLHVISGVTHTVAPSPPQGNIGFVLSDLTYPAGALVQNAVLKMDLACVLMRTSEQAYDVDYVLYVSDGTVTVSAPLLLDVELVDDPPQVIHANALFKLWNTSFSASFMISLNGETTYAYTPSGILTMGGITPTEVIRTSIDLETHALDFENKSITIRLLVRAAGTGNTPNNIAFYNSEDPIVLYTLVQSPLPPA